MHAYRLIFHHDLQKVTSKVTTPSSQSKSDYELLATSHNTGVGAHGERTYNLSLEIPQSAQIPNFNLCQLFKQKTKLEVSVRKSITKPAYPEITFTYKKFIWSFKATLLSNCFVLYLWNRFDFDTIIIISLNFRGAM